MLANGSSMFLLIPGVNNKRILHAGKVIESNAESFVCEFEETIEPAAGSDVLVFADNRGKFFQQGASVTQLRQTEPKPLVAFLRVGDPVSAEQRQTFRVSVVTLGIIAKLDNEARCPVVDVSPEGLGVIAVTEHKIGSIVQVSFEYERHIIKSIARVQTVQRRPDGKFRYGLLTNNKDARATLGQISMSIQRTQLRRLSGAA